MIDPPDNCVSVKINYTENPFCPASMIEEAENLKKKNLGLYRWIWLGECRQANENALWKLATMIQPYRSRDINFEELDRIVVAVAPAVTSAARSDETGIVVAGIKKGRNGADSHYYVLEDCTMRGSPSKWARAVTDAYWYYKADRVVAEVNNGGDLVEQNIRGADRQVSFKAVRATRGKVLRAEQVSKTTLKP